MQLKKLVLLSLAFILLHSSTTCALADCCDSASDSNTNSVSDSNFDFDLYKDLAASKQKENFLISPYSISSALTMTYTGAAGETKGAMAKVLGLSGKDEDIKNRAKADIDSLQKLENGTMLEIANALFANKNIDFKKEFLDENNKYFYAGTQSLDFSAAGALDKINGWVSEKTHKRIEKILDKISGDAILYLINAIYFKGTWQDQFKKENTKETDFHKPDGTGKVSMMSLNRSNFSYMQNQDCQAIYLPYKDHRLGLFVFLPGKHKKLEDFEKSLDAKSFEKLTGSFSIRAGTIKLPRFKIEDSMRLKENLSKLGMSEAFDQNKADFTSMTNEKNRVSINDVIHKTFMEVNEEGTEAAAVTAVEMVMTSARIEPEPPFEMTCDRPFFIALQDRQTQKILFLGHIVNP